MTIRKVFYLVILFIFIVVAAILACCLAKVSLVFVICYQSMTLVLKSCIRLYILPDIKFDPYTGIAEDDTKEFKCHIRNVYSIGLLIGILCIILLLLVL
jgi:hypothetical protein